MTAIGNAPPCAANSVSISPKRSVKLVFFSSSSSPNPYDNPYELRWNRATTFDFSSPNRHYRVCYPPVRRKRSAARLAVCRSPRAFRASAMSRSRQPIFHADSLSNAGNLNRCSCLANYIQSELGIRLIERSSLRPTSLTISHVSHCDGETRRVIEARLGQSHHSRLYVKVRRIAECKSDTVCKPRVE